MHDLIQEMGHYIVRGENPKSPEKHNRVWQREDVKICAMDATQENDRIEALQLEWEYLKELPDSFPYVVENMTKLRLISCYCYQATSFSRKFQATKLCCLELRDSLIEQLWEGYKHLPNLKSSTIHASGKCN
ncbi:hypothetical protein L6452_13183 [Arctium lappa]|uniref:Uncharacterized protein n=1 Tax=Arctium lappa TaxID=4217 RepID=A0ACB9CHH8_ARCLA|nr:hypothetical protein L6452_13183 [Arctium lappa]